MSELPPPSPTVSLVPRGIGGGTLMGLANLVPGISGGTMLLAAGVYPDFIEAVAAVTTLRFRLRHFVVLGLVGGSAVLAIGLLAGLLKSLVLDHRWVMYSLFIGLTLGGLPLVWRMARPITRAVWLFAGLGTLAMAALGLAQASGGSSLFDGAGNTAMLVLAGTAGAAAMVLPGVSGGYLLLLLGQYIPILGAIDEVKDALSAGSLAAAVTPAVSVLLPVGIGVALGVVVVSNAVRWLLHHHPKPTLGFLAGLLVGAVLGLWPFQETVTPGDTQTTIGKELDLDDVETAPFRPSGGQAAASLALVVAGAGLTAAISRLGGSSGSDARAAGGAKAAAADS